MRQAKSDLFPKGRGEKERGLTLVELLVVIVILGLASSVVLLNAPPTRPAVRDDAERFAARMQLALDAAIADGGAMRLVIDPEGYSFEQLAGSDWVAVEDIPALAKKSFSESVTATPEIEDAANDNARALGVEDREEDDEEDEGAIRVPLDPLGAQTPFTLQFSSRHGAWTVSVSAGAEVSVTEDA